MALQQLRSSTANKRPTAAAMSDGQLAVNTNATNPGLFFKDADGSVRKVGPVFIGSSAPNSSPATGGSTGHAVGEQWLDNTGGIYVLKIWDGTAWRSESGTFVDVSGDTMTGDLVMNNANLVFEGATADDFETTLTVTDPTADRTITLPNVSGTVVTTGDTGTVTSTMIVDGTIVNADVNASAAIAGTKISPDFGSQNVITTGKIEVGTVIDLNADGSATFGSFNTSSTTTHGATIDQFANSHSGVRVQSTDAATTVGEFFAAYRGSNPVFQVTTGGTATFTGNVTSKATFLNELQSGYSAVGSAYKVFSGSSTFVNILNNGTATFASEVVAGVRDSQGVFMTSGGALESFVSGSRVYSLGSNGSATFAGPIIIGTWANTSDSAIYMVNQANSGQIVVKGDGTSTASAFSVYSGGFSGSTNQVASIQANGSAIFAGPLLINGGTDVRIELGTTGTTGTNDRNHIRADGANLKFNTASGGRHIFEQNGTEKMRLRDNGRFQVIQTATDGHNFITTQSSASNINLMVGVHSATTLDNGTAAFVILTNGTYSALSDETHKKNIVTARDGYLDDLNKLRVVKYNWKEQDDTESKELGLIAQEVEQVFPGLVHETKIGDEETGSSSKGIKVSVLNYMLLKALQEASAKIETLEAKVAALEAG